MSPSLADLFRGRFASEIRRMALRRKAGAPRQLSNAGRRLRMRFEPLEPRLLLSADLNPVIDGFLATLDQDTTYSGPIHYDYVAGDGFVTVGNSVGDGVADLAMAGVKLTFTDLEYDGANARWDGWVGVEATSATLFPGLLNVPVADDGNDTTEGDDADLFAVAGVIDLTPGTQATLHLDDIDAEKIGWPKFLDVEIADLELNFSDFRTNNDLNSLHLAVELAGLDTGNDTLNELLSADNPLFGLTIEGFAEVTLAISAIEDTVEAGANHDFVGAMRSALAAATATSLDGFGGNISGKLFKVGSVDAKFIYHKVTVDPDGVEPQPEETATYIAVEGGFSIGDEKWGGRGAKLDIAFAFSDLGPLQFFISGGPIKRFEPTTGLTLEEVHLGVRFNTTIEELQTKTDFQATAATVDTAAGARVTLTIPEHDLAIGNEFRIRNADNANYNGDFEVIGVNGDEVTYDMVADPGLFVGDAEVLRLTITDPFDLRDPGLESGVAPPDSISVWRDQLDAAVANQIQGDDVWAQLFGEVVIGGGATLSIDPIPDTVMQLKVDLLIDTDFRILLTGNLSFLDGLVEFPATLYADLSKLFDGTGRFLFLADLPEVPVVDPLLVLRGEAYFEALAATDVFNALVTEDAGFWDIELELALDNPSEEFIVGDNAVVFGANPSAFDGTYEVVGISDDANTITVRSSTNPGVWAAGGTREVANENALLGGLRMGLEGGIDLNIPFVTTLTLEGDAQLEFRIPAPDAVEDLRLDLEFDVTLSETHVGNIGDANGKFHLTIDADAPLPDLANPFGGLEIWGAALLTTDFEFLETVGLFASASGLLRINSSPSDKPKPAESLEDLHGHTVLVALPAQSFALRLDGSVDFRIDFNGDHNFALSESAFLVEGAFVLEFSAEQGFNVAVFREGAGGTLAPATLQLGPTGHRLLTFDVFGFLAVRDDGFAANIVLSADTSLPLGLASIEATAALVVNTTGEEVLFRVPGGAVDPNRSGLTLRIPKSAPANPSAVLETLSIDDLINGSAWDVDPALPGAPYGVVFLRGELELLSVLDLDVSGYILLSANVVSLEVNFSAAGNFLNLASASASGSLFFSSEGEFEVDVDGFVQLGPDWINIHGGAELTISFLDDNGKASGGDLDMVLDVEGLLSVGATVFGIDVGDLTLGVGYNSNSGNINVRVPYLEPFWDSSCWSTFFGDICVWYPNVRTNHFTMSVGTLTAQAEPPPPPVLGQVDGNGVLTLNVGAAAAARNLLVDEEDETVLIDRVGNAIQVSMFGHTQSFSGVTSILIADMGAGNDFLDVRAAVFQPLEVHFGDGNDRLKFAGSGAVLAFGGNDDDRLESGSAGDQLYGGAGDDVIDGGGGQDWIEGGDDGDTLFGGEGNDAIFGGAGNDMIAGDLASVEGSTTSAVFRTTASAMGGSDALHGGSGADIIFGGSGSDSLAGGAGADSLFGEDGIVTIPVNPPGSLPAISLLDLGFGGGDLFSWSVGDGNDVVDGQLGSDALDIFGTDGGAEQVSLSATGAGFSAGVGAESLGVGGVEVANIEGRRGGDSFTVNDLAGSGLQLVNLGLGADSVSDAVVVNGSSGGDVFSIAPAGGLLRVQKMGGVTIDIADANPSSGGDALALYSAGGEDTVNILGTGAGTITSVHGGDGADTFNVGSLAPAMGGTVNGIFGPLSVDGGEDFDALIVDDSGDADPNTGALTATTVSGLGMSADIGYGALESLSIGLGSGADTFTIVSTHAGTTLLDANAGDDTVNVWSTAGNTTVNGGADDDTVNVGSLAPAMGGTLEGIAGLLTINGNEPASGSDVLNVDDSGDTGPNSGALTGTAVTGLGMAGGIAYGTIETLNIDLGSGADGFTIESTHAGTTNLDTSAGDDTVNVWSTSGETSVDGGADDDTVNVGGLAPAPGGTVNGIGAPLAIGGGGGSDALNVDDTGDANPNSGVLTATTLTGLGMAHGIAYLEFEALEVSLGAGGNHFDILGTMRREDVGTSTVVNSGDGDDVVTVSLDAATDGPLALNLQGGEDTLDASGSSLGLAISGGAGGDAIAGGSGDDTLWGGGGDDVLRGNLGSDTLHGDDGDDVLLGDSGVVSGGNVILTDVAQVTGELPLGELGLLATSQATVHALLEADLVLLAGRLDADGLPDTRALLLELLADGDDMLWGGEGDDALFGQRGDDLLYGEGGNDLLAAGAGNDQAQGGAGDDMLVGDTLTVDADAARTPNVANGLLIGGAVVLPAVQSVAGAAPNALTSALARVFGDGANSLLPADDGGTAFVAYATVVSDFAHHLGQLRGNDVLGGGEGDDVLVGDDQAVFARSLAFDAASMARAEALARSLFDVADDLSDFVHRQYDLLCDDHDRHDDSRTVIDNVFTVGADTLDGGDGNDVLIGDDNLLVDTSITLPVGLAANFERFAEGMELVAHELAHVVQDVGDLDRHLREATALVPHKNHFHEVLERHADLVLIGNDTLLGGSGNDLIVGDAFVVHTARVTLVPGGSPWHSGWSDDWHWRRHHHHHDDDWAPRGIKGGADTISGGSGNDLIWGDSLVLVSSTVARGAGVGWCAYDEARDDAKDGLEAFVALTCSAVDWLAPQGGGHGHCDGPAFDNGDDISGGDGDDIAFGQGGDDTLRGDAGNDWLVGGDGRDQLDGGPGRDRSTSGSENSSALRKAGAAHMIDWDVSFQRYGLSFAPLDGLTAGKGHARPNIASFAFPAYDRPRHSDD